MSGSGNDFIFMDGMDGSLAWIEGNWVRNVCRRALSVGADGLVVLEKDKSHDFAWRFLTVTGQWRKCAVTPGGARRVLPLKRALPVQP
jgi:diaminopimelate epimerase